jgi:hypothetical protein
MNRLILVVLISSISCNSFNLKSQNSISEKYADEILNEDKLRETTDLAIQFIVTKQSGNLLNLFSEEVSKSISPSQISSLIEKINSVIRINGLPNENNIQPALKAVPRGDDTIFVNHIYYRFSSRDNSVPKVLTFSFLKEYGENKIIGMNLIDSPFSGKDVQPNFEASDSFEFDFNKLSQFRIYYSEAEPTTYFNGNKGIFSIEGNQIVFSESGLQREFESFQQELSQSKFEKKEIFFQLLNRGENVEFIQADLHFSDKNYSVFIYLPLSGGTIDNSTIILQQRQYVNLGYEFILLKKDYPTLVKRLSGIIKLDLNKYYSINP